MSGIGDFTEWWKEGANAYIRGLPQSKNPHDKKSMAWEDWRNGWVFARGVQYVNEATERMNRIRGIE